MVCFALIPYFGNLCWMVGNSWETDEFWQSYEMKAEALFWITGFASNFARSSNAMEDLTAWCGVRNRGVVMGMWRYPWYAGFAVYLAFPDWTVGSCPRVLLFGDDKVDDILLENNAHSFRFLFLFITKSIHSFLVVHSYSIWKLYRREFPAFTFLSSVHYARTEVSICLLSLDPFPLIYISSFARCPASTHSNLVTIRKQTLQKCAFLLIPTSTLLRLI